MVYDMIRWASHLVAILAAAMAGCFFMMPNRRSPLALLLLAMSLMSTLMVVLHAPDGRTWAQYYITRSLLH